MAHPGMEHGGGDPSFLLFGMGRVGTSLLREIINSSEEAWLSPECHWMPQIITGYDYAQWYQPYPAQQLQEIWYEQIRRLNRALAVPKRVWGLRTTGLTNCRYAKRIWDYYPHAKMIFVIRDPRDLFISMLRTGNPCSPAMFNSFCRGMEDFRKTSGIEPAKFKLLKYEDVVSTPVETLNDLCDFLEIRFSERMLLPLCRKISRNEIPSLRQEDLRDRIIQPDPRNVQRFKGQVLDEDLLDMNRYSHLLESLGYPVYRFEGRRLHIETEGSFAGRLLGAEDPLTHSARVTEKTRQVSIHCAGVVGIRMLQAPGTVCRIGIEGLGEFRRSSAYPDFYFLRVADRSAGRPVKDPVKWSVPLFLKRIRPRANARIGLYTAGSATRIFLEHFKARGLDRQLQIEVIIDQNRRDSMQGIPIIAPHEIAAKQLDYIWITSHAFYLDIKKTLENLGFSQGRQFFFMAFACQDDAH